VWQATLLTVAACCTTDSHARAYVSNSRSKPHRRYSNFPLRCESIVGMHNSSIKAPTLVGRDGTNMYAKPFKVHTANMYAIPYKVHSAQ